MNLNLIGDGGFLHVKDGMFEVQVEGKKHKFSPSKVERILIGTRFRLTSDVVVLALKHKIDVLFLDHFGDPTGRIWQPALGSTARIRKRQLAAAHDGSGLGFARGWIDAKLAARLAFLADLATRRKTKAAAIREAMGRIDGQRTRLTALEGHGADLAGKMRGHEGSAGRVYFEALAWVMPPAFPFQGRSFRPARDPFNCMLNYGYGVLYGHVEKACHVAGLDPHVGFLHRDGYNQTSFVFDFIEPFRVPIERSVFGLFSGKKVNRSMFDDLENGVILNKEGKALVISALGQTFDEKVRQGARRVAWRHQIQLAAFGFAQRLLQGAEAVPEDVEVVLC
ncbi:CRISPR-associated endonuclease Cas1 [Sulfidibacter corallicola]|uniref:CRISPR-associated endonuclease Cas1 n=1 Tax=Sulfidibacter corallicola TaxID=2818388 RepID=A0A8A4TP25_SULCO|nr:CRISPR-associated endonuclease Cas1 [Sulfidibacter corallicola]QTD50954.1 CRISPR-associated endonuclease Cas1 [Sulfidibacter corallicola]